MGKILAMILSSDTQNRNVVTLAVIPALLWRDRKQRQENPCGLGPAHDIHSGKTRDLASRRMGGKNPHPSLFSNFYMCPVVNTCLHPYK